MRIKTLLFIICFLFAFNLYSQPTPPTSHGNNTTSPSSGSAPIGTATALVLSLAAIYTGVKMYRAKINGNFKEEEKEKIKSKLNQIKG